MNSLPAIHLQPIGVLRRELGLKRKALAHGLAHPEGLGRIMTDTLPGDISRIEQELLRRKQEAAKATP